MRSITWSEFCTWVSGKKVIEEFSDRYGLDAEHVYLKFDDGSKAIITSNYDEGYSEITPGNGIEPPTVKVEP